MLWVFKQTKARKFIYILCLDTQPIEEVMVAVQLLGIASPSLGPTLKNYQTRIELLGNVARDGNSPKRVDNWRPFFFTYSQQKSKANLSTTLALEKIGRTRWECLTVWVMNACLGRGR